MFKRTEFLADFPTGTRRDDLSILITIMRQQNGSEDYYTLSLPDTLKSKQKYALYTFGENGMKSVISAYNTSSEYQWMMAYVSSHKYILRGLYDVCMYKKYK